MASSSHVTRLPSPGSKPSRELPTAPPPDTVSWVDWPAITWPAGPTSSWMSGGVDGMGSRGTAMWVSLPQLCCSSPGQGSPHTDEGSASSVPFEHRQWPACVRRFYWLGSLKIRVCGTTKLFFCENVWHRKLEENRINSTFRTGCFSRRQERCHCFSFWFRYTVHIASTKITQRVPTMQSYRSTSNYFVVRDASRSQSRLSKVILVTFARKKELSKTTLNLLIIIMLLIITKWRILARQFKEGGT